MGIGINLKNALKKHDLTVAELSRKTGISTNTLYAMIRRDNKKIDPNILFLICENSDITVFELIEDYEDYMAKYFDPSASFEEMRIGDYVLTQLGNEDEKTSTIFIDTRGMENHPYEKFRRGEKLTPEEEEELQLYFDEAIKAIPNIFKEFGNKLKEHYQLLNEKGQQRAEEQLDRTLEQIEMLTKIPEYQRKEENED